MIVHSEGERRVFLSYNKLLDDVGIKKHKRPWSNRKLSGEVCSSHSFPICCLQRIDSITAAALLRVPHFIITHKMVNVF